LLVFLVGTGLSSSANSEFHCVQRILGSVQKSLVKVPEVVSFDSLGVFRRNRVNVGVKRVGQNGLDQIVDGSFNFQVLRNQVLGLFVNVIFLDLHKLI